MVLLRYAHERYTASALYRHGHPQDEAERLAQAIPVGDDDAPLGRVEPVPAAAGPADATVAVPPAASNDASGRA